MRRDVVTIEGLRHRYGTTAPEGSGLSGMRERITALGGPVERRAQRGTTVLVTVPAREVPA